LRATRSSSPEVRGGAGRGAARRAVPRGVAAGAWRRGPGRARGACLAGHRPHRDVNRVERRVSAIHSMMWAPPGGEKKVPVRVLELLGTSVPRSSARRPRVPAVRLTYAVQTPQQARAGGGLLPRPSHPQKLPPSPPKIDTRAGRAQPMTVSALTHTRTETANHPAAHIVSLLAPHFLGSFSCSLQRDGDPRGWMRGDKQVPSHIIMYICREGSPIGPNTATWVRARRGEGEGQRRLLCAEGWSSPEGPKSEGWRPGRAVSCQTPRPSCPHPPLDALPRALHEEGAEASCLPATAPRLCHAKGWSAAPGPADEKENSLHPLLHGLSAGHPAPHGVLFLSPCEVAEEGWPIPVIGRF